MKRAGGEVVGIPLESSVIFKMRGAECFNTEERFCYDPEAGLKIGG